LVLDCIDLSLVTGARAGPAGRSRPSSIFAFEVTQHLADSGDAVSAGVSEGIGNKPFPGALIEDRRSQMPLKSGKLSSRRSDARHTSSGGALWCGRS